MRIMSILITIFIFMGSRTVSGTVIDVPGYASSIQEGLNIASYGDTVQVAAGIYYENIIWPTQNGIKLFGAGMDSTIIDGNNQASVMRFDDANIIDTSTVVRGFTLTNGNALPPWPESQGGGICLFYASPILEYLNITGNTADDFGGGIYMWGSQSRPIIRYVIIANNTALSHGGVDCFAGAPVFDHVTIAENSPGGMYFETYGTIINCIVAFNTYYGVRVEGTSFEPTYISMGYSDINDALQMIGYATVDTTGEIIDIDPDFVDLAGDDYHLMPESPCIDAGDPGYPYDPDGTRTDMGAFYFDQTTAVDNLNLAPGEYIIFQNYPNPFNALTTIKYELPRQSMVTIEIYDIQGRKVNKIQSGLQPAGYHQVIWDAEEFSSGVYLYKLQAGDYSEVKKMVLVK
jgi:hypothetical protein